MSRPLIGLTMDSATRPDRCELGSFYAISIAEAGGLPLAIPYPVGHPLIADLLDELDGILFIGGDDLDPALYGQTWHPKAIRLDPHRQAFELALAAEVEKRRLPTLGICLGCQVLNVLRGGTLHQFLPDVPRPNPIEHRKLDRDFPRHPVRLEPGSQLARAIGQTEIVANTYHKQAIATLGRGLRPVAWAPDGIIEGFEDPTFPLFAAVQWHPERLHTEAEHLALFRLLVDRARG